MTSRVTLLKYHNEQGACLIHAIRQAPCYTEAAIHLPILYKCPHCGKPVQVGQKCECIQKVITAKTIYRNKVLADINYSAAEQAKVTAAYDARHTHDNKAVIDGITAASVQAWNAARANVNADWNANSGDAQILNKPNLSGFITRLTSDLEYYYTKTQTYTQAEVNALVSAIPKFKIEVVQTLPTSNISAATVYLLPDTNADSLNLYTEYIYVNNGWEMLGTQTVDLSGYVTTADLNTALTSAMAAKADASHTHAPSDITGLAEALAGKQAALTFDGTPTEGSNNPVTSGGVYEALQGKSNTGHTHSRFSCEMVLDIGNDFNNFTGNGIWFVSTLDQFSSNKPTSSGENGALLVFRGSENMIFQLFLGSYTNNMYFRCYRYGAGWAAWRKVSAT